MATLAADLRTIWQLTMGRVRGSSHAERLENFYSPQAANYDAFRRKMLHGRDELFQMLDMPDGGTWIDLGAGTGENLERIGSRINSLESVHLVDLSESLLDVAKARCKSRGWSHVTTNFADVTTFSRSQGTADVVTFSYSLTMIPNWFEAIDQAMRLLKPGGVIGIVDFYISRKFPTEGRRKHAWFTRSFWPTWFANDNVFLNSDHLPYLTSQFEMVRLLEREGSLPLIPLLKVPHYIFIGRKPINNLSNVVQNPSTSSIV